ncbi:MAG: hypothetical protein EA427_01935 [Spirochaetaceae bacterium]|nr:MAG: hypothetical protein EA427_01935 [Spirochaetaceae bacterium]
MVNAVRRYLVPVVLVATMLVLLAGCATTDRKAEAVDRASLQTEPLTSWGRPMEIGYEFVGDVEGTSSFRSILGFSMGEVPADSSSLILGVIGGASRVPPGVNNAVHDAVSRVGADGLYVTSVSSESRSFLFLFRERKVTVRGKAIRIIDLGQVDQARADNYRYLRALPEGITLPDGDTWLPVAP